MIVADILGLLVGLAFLVKGSTSLVRASTGVAKQLGVSDFVIGLTLVALGTSVPELASAIVASLRHQSGIIIGNIVGANISNIALITGVVALVGALKTREEILKRDGYIMFFASLLLYAFLWNGIISTIEGLLFLLLYVAYIVFLFEARQNEKRHYHFKEFIGYFLGFGYLATILKQRGFLYRKENIEHTMRTKGFARDLLVLVISGAAIASGAHVVVGSAVSLAELLHLPLTVIGILLALGTTLPELSVSLSAAYKGYGDIAIGNIIGSNITNIFLVLGISASISSMQILPLTKFYAAPYLVLMSGLLLASMKSDWAIKRREGIVFLVLYAVFLIALLGFVIPLAS